MSDTATINYPDRIKLPVQFDVDLLQRDLEGQQLRDFIFYNVLPLTMPRPKDDLKGDTDFADGSWATWHDSQILSTSPYLLEVVEYFRKHCDVTLVRLLRLAPGATVQEHTDPTLAIHIPKSVVRMTVPIKTNDQVTFFLNNEPVPLKAGECWYLRLSDPHSIINESGEERVNMTIDMVPNEWVRGLMAN